MGREGERKREREIWMCERYSNWKPPPRDLARNPGMCPGWESNWQPFGLRAGTQSIEPHQPGQNFKYSDCLCLFLICSTSKGIRNCHLI